MKPTEKEMEEAYRWCNSLAPHEERDAKVCAICNLIATALAEARVAALEEAMDAVNGKAYGDAVDAIRSLLSPQGGK